MQTVHNLLIQTPTWIKSNSEKKLIQSTFLFSNSLEDQINIQQVHTHALIISPTAAR